MMQMHQRQQVRACVPGGIATLELPAPEDEALQGVPWGRFDVLFTPAFWAGRAWLSTLDGERRTHRLGRTLREEIAACLLGGFGIPAEVGLAAFSRIRDRGLLDGEPAAALLMTTLREPLRIGERVVRYRFASQKATYLAQVLRQVDGLASPSDDVTFRDSLADLPGIGLKTASWITRNTRDSDAVAILDVHVCRACVVAGVFRSGVRVAGAYRRLEDRYLAFASAIDVRPSLLDSLMWENMRRLAGWVPRECIEGR
jgi:thermostable 8-oxoguanine DNA glycosylase